MSNVYNRRHQGTSSVSNVIYQNFSHGAAFYTLSGKHVNVMLELKFRQISNVNMLYLEYANIFAEKNVRSFKSFSHFSDKNISVFGNKVIKHLYRVHVLTSLLS